MSQFNKIRGFSIIEVAVAIAVLVLVLGGVTVVFVGGAKAARKTQQETAAYSLARGFLEVCSDWTLLDEINGTVVGRFGIGDGIVTNTPADNPYSPANLPANTALVNFNVVTLNNITYTPSLGISDGPISSARLKALNVTISWSDGAIARSISVSTLKGDY